MTTFWNADVYHQVGTPMQNWGEAVMADLDLQGNEKVLDAGCGSGKVTVQLAQRLPRGRVYPLDSSPQMIEKLEQELRCAPQLAQRVTPMVADLTRFHLPELVDWVFSNAVFHWIPDDAALFGNLLAATLPGGRLRAQCGGAGNVGRVYEAVEIVQSLDPFASHMRSFQDSKKYRMEAEARRALEDVGWANVETRSFPAPVTFDTSAEAVTYLGTIILRDHLGALPAELHTRYLEAVVETSLAIHGKPFTADYVRLDLFARRPV